MKYCTRSETQLGARSRTGADRRPYGSSSEFAIGFPAPESPVHVFITTLRNQPKTLSLHCHLAIALCLTFCWVADNRAAEAVQFSEDDVEVSYIYATILGTGTYKIRDRRITMFKIPLSWTQRKTTTEVAGWKWFLPVVAGYDDLSEVDSDWISALLPDQLVTLTFLPGIEYSYPVTPRWHLKPFVQAGVGREFSEGETIYLTQLGVRSLNLYNLGENWELRWGNTLRWAAEYQAESKDRIRLGVFDSGLDIRRNLPCHFFHHPTDLGVYYIFQHLIPKWTASDAPDYEAATVNLHELGLSIGLKAPRKIFGINMQRVRLGYKTGGSFRGWTIGTEFPF
ncbi:MAG: hypothetical protein ABFR65_11350 [Pseudomonadota bacterium]